MHHVWLEEEEEEEEEEEPQKAKISHPNAAASKTSAAHHAQLRTLWFDVNQAHTWKLILN